MKKLITVINFLLIVSSCSSQTKGFSIIGKWQLIETVANNGAKDYHTPVKNGRIILFKKDNIVTDNLGNKGSYEIHGDSLRISLKSDEFYRFWFWNNNYKKINFTPVTPKYEITCDEGCQDVYVKLTSD